MPQPDVCIVGAGPAGSALAARLARAGASVTLVEAGPRYALADRAGMVRRYVRGEDPWELVERGWTSFTVGGGVDYPLEETRAQGVGGGTLHWEGYTPRLTPADLRVRTQHGVGRDWPLAYEDLEPFYGQAEAELGVAGAQGAGMPPRSGAFPLAPFPYSYADGFYRGACEALGIHVVPLPQARNSVAYGGRAACSACATCFVCPTGAKATADLTHVDAALQTGNLRLLAETRVDRLVAHGGRVVAARVHTAEGRAADLRAERFVLATGAVENARLLLLSADADRRTGLANRSGRVGRGLMIHPVVDVYGELTEPLYPFRIGFSTAASFDFVAPADRAREGSLLVEFMNNAGPTPAAMVAGSDRWGEDLERAMREEFGHTAQIRFLVEQLPRDDNAVELDGDVRDPAGRAVPRIRQSLGEHERRTMDRAESIGRAILERMRARHIRRRNLFAAHQAGTAVMGDDPVTSVVDPTLKAHDMENLYVLGSSAFPTAGAANPTLTIVALALRLADHLTGRSAA